MGGRRRHRRPVLGAGRLRERGVQLSGTTDPDELVGQAADELYGLAPEDFTEARDEQVKAAKDAGNRKLAVALGKLRRPTVSAYVLNLLVRDQPEVGEQLVALGEELRKAQEELSGPALRQLSTQRQQLVGALVRSARKVAAGAGVKITQAVQYELEQTLHAALADPAVAAEIGAGRLVKAASRTGFDAAPPEPKTPPARRLRAVRDDERAEDPAVVRERRQQEQREAERERLSAALAEAEEVRDETEEALAAAEQELADAERDRAEAGELVEDLRSRLAEAEDAERDAVRHERDAQRERDAATRRRDAAARKAEDAAARLADL
ncbi:MAG TPA: hypothetical protein VLM05_10935 [Mycobacteriales bacterium]|nr:hypothetical protein [Mycobacteriales bacterium]